MQPTNRAQVCESWSELHSVNVSVPPADKIAYHPTDRALLDNTVNCEWYKYTVEVSELHVEKENEDKNKLPFINTCNKDTAALTDSAY